MGCRRRGLGEVWFSPMNACNLFKDYPILRSNSSPALDQASPLVYLTSRLRTK